jgi:lipid-A-disaccharide synthase
LIGGDKREKMLSDFAELREIIGGSGASDRFAEDIVKTLKK